MIHVAAGKEVLNTLRADSRLASEHRSDIISAACGKRNTDNRLSLTL